MDVDPEIDETLKEIVELGFVRIGNGTVDVRYPIYNVATKYHMQVTLEYLKTYSSKHSEFRGEFFLCLYDGWREYSEPEFDLSRRRYVQWRELSKEEKMMFMGFGSEDEPRFMHKHPDTSLYPVLCRPVLAYCRHLNDTSVRLIPDAEFLKNEFKVFTNQVQESPTTFDNMLPKIIWRGSPNINEGYRYLGTPLAHPRTALVNMVEKNPEVAPGLFLKDFCDASFARTTIKDMLQYKYQLDVDGHVSAWSGFYWKLLSPALVIKAPTHWEQWYYDRLVPYEHYVPLSSFQNLKEVYIWCTTHNEKCATIAEQATKFAKSINKDYSLNEYII